MKGAWPGGGSISGHPHMPTPASLPFLSWAERSPSPAPPAQRNAQLQAAHVPSKEECT